MKVRITQEFLDQLEKALPEAIEPDLEKALFHALTYAFKLCPDRLPDYDPKSPVWFTKSFRVADVTPDGNLDMVLWSLLNESDVFWTEIGKYAAEQHRKGAA